MNLLPLLYALLAALTGVSASVAASEPRIAAVAQVDRAATAVAAILAEPRVRAFEALRPAPRRSVRIDGGTGVRAMPPRAQRPALRRE